MSLRDISHQAAIELRQRDTEYVTLLKDERERLIQERAELPIYKYFTLGAWQRRKAIAQRLIRIEELLS